MKGKNGVVVLKPIQFRGENQNEVECKTDHNKFYSVRYNMEIQNTPKYVQFGKIIKILHWK